MTLAQIISARSGIPEASLTDDFNFAKSAAIDSLSWFEAILEIEDEFGIRIEEGRRFETFGSLRIYVEELCGVSQ